VRKSEIEGGERRSKREGEKEGEKLLLGRH